MKKKEPDSEEKDKMEIEAMQQTLNQIKINTTALRKQIDLAKKTKKKPTKIKRLRLSVPKVPLTYKEKEDLCKLITDLSAADLPGLLEIIQSANPSSGGSDDGEFEIDIERIDDMTLLDVKKYVEKCALSKTERRTVANHRIRRQNRTAPGAVEPLPPDTDRLAIAEIQTNQRINQIQREIQDIKSLI